jgi:hypothetical protein
MFLRLNRHAIISLVLLFKLYVSPDQVSGPTQGTGPWSAQDEKWKNHAVKQIERFTHSKKAAKIRADMEQHFRIGGGFALGWPVSVFGLISDGIKYFSK